MAHEDLPLLAEWLGRAHVREWWREPIEDELAQGVAGRFVIVVDGRDAGMIQTYPAGGDVAEIDLLIGEEELTGGGLGPQVLDAFVRTLAPSKAVIARVDETNRRSWRAFEKAGFRHVGDLEEEGLPHRLMRLDRR